MEIERSELGRGTEKEWSDKCEGENEWGEEDRTERTKEGGKEGVWQR